MYSLETRCFFALLLASGEITRTRCFSNKIGTCRQQQLSAIAPNVRQLNRLPATRSVKFFQRNQLCWQFVEEIRCRFFNRAKRWKSFRRVQQLGRPKKLEENVPGEATVSRKAGPRPGNMENNKKWKRAKRRDD